jgi:hypothetical protein
MQQEITVHALFWKNIRAELLQLQKAIFEKFGVPLVQHFDDMRDHGEWMDSIVRASPDNGLIVFSDIDAFPTDMHFFSWVLENISSRTIVGLAQAANHLPEPGVVYAGPSFLAFYKATWRELGEPSLCATDRYDPAQLLSVRAHQEGVALCLTHPYACIEPRWPLADRGVFGIGTFYDAGYFHLFQSRFDSAAPLYEAVASDVRNGSPLNFGKYISIQQDVLGKKPVGLRAKLNSLVRRFAH